MTTKQFVLGMAGLMLVIITMLAFYTPIHYFSQLHYNQCRDKGFTVYYCSHRFSMASEIDYQQVKK